MVIEEDMPLIEEEECPSAYTNPLCPYVTVINRNTNDIKIMKKALVGDDMQGGIVAKVRTCEIATKILIFLGTLSLGTCVTILVKILFHV